MGPSHCLLCLPRVPIAEEAASALLERPGALPKLLRLADGQEAAEVPLQPSGKAGGRAQPAQELRQRGGQSQLAALLESAVHSGWLPTRVQLEDAHALLEVVSNDAGVNFGFFPSARMFPCTRLPRPPTGHLSTFVAVILIYHECPPHFLVPRFRSSPGAVSPVIRCLNAPTCCESPADLPECGLSAQLGLPDMKYTLLKAPAHPSLLSQPLPFALAAATCPPLPSPALLFPSLR